MESRPDSDHDHESDNLHEHQHGCDHHPHDHGHNHTQMDHPGRFRDRPVPLARRDLARRAFTVGVGGPVGSGKTALVLALCRKLRDQHSLAVVTNDIFTREDAEFLIRNQALPTERIDAVETGGCPHAAIREDISANLVALEELSDRFHPEILLLESGGDNLAADFSRELADYTIYVIDVAGGDKIPRKGGPGITQSDLLVINKTDLAPAVGADLNVMDRDSRLVRGEGPFVFSQVKHGDGVDAIAEHVLQAWQEVTQARKTAPTTGPYGARRLTAVRFRPFAAARTESNVAPAEVFPPAGR